MCCTSLSPYEYSLRKAKIVVIIFGIHTLITNIYSSSVRTLGVGGSQLNVSSVECDSTKIVHSQPNGSHAAFLTAWSYEVG